MRSISIGLILMLVPGLVGTVSTGVLPWHEPPLEFSCEAFPADMTEADLVERFGADHVVTSAPLRWGGEYRGTGTVVFPEREHARLEIIWQDKEANQRTRRVVVRGDSTRWRTRQGISLGMDLKTVEKLNRKPFRLAGFQTVLMGAVRSWSGGALEQPEHDSCTLWVRLQPDSTYDFATFRRVRSGREYSSAHPAMQELNPTVVSLTITHSRGPR